MRDKKLSKITIDLIKQAIEESKSYDRFVLCNTITEILEKRYEKTNMEYYLKRIELEDTGKILDAIDLYFYTYPHLIPGLYPNVD